MALDRRFDLLAHAYAHRGLWGPDLSENSLGAFRAAAHAGLGCELDVRPTKDGELVVFHNAAPQRLCGEAVRIDEASLKVLQTVSLPDGTMIPLLEEAIDAMSGRPVLIELKIDAPAKQPSHLADAVADAVNRFDAPLAVMSFDEPTVLRLRELVKDRLVGQLIEGASELSRANSLAKAIRAKAAGCDYLAPHHTALTAVAEANLGLPLVAWTIRDPAELATAHAHGAAPIFEGFSPDLAKPRGRPI